MGHPACVNCRTQVRVGQRPTVGQLVACHSCGEIMEIIWLDPVELDWPIDDLDYDDEAYEQEGE